MEEKNNILTLVNTEGKLMRQEPPELKLGEGIKKLLPYLSKQGKEKLEEFYEDLRKEGLKEDNIKDKYVGPLITLSYVINMDLDKAMRVDNKNLNAWINNSKYGYYRRDSMRLALKKAFRFWKGTGTHNPEEVWDVVRPKGETKPKPRKPKKMIKTNEEAKCIIDKVKNERDQFYMALDWNTAGRPVEIRTIKWGQIYEVDGKIKAILETAKKSGDEDDRIITLVFALPYYHRWKTRYKEIFGIKKDEDINELYIFRKFTNLKKNNCINEPLDEGWYSKVFKGIKEELCLPGFTPKIWRKWTISRWERKGIPHSLIKKMSGHSKNSNAIEHYSFHDEDECDEEILRIEGYHNKNIIEEEKPMTDCKRCNKPNFSKNETCEFCGFGLTEEVIIKQQLKKDDEIEKLRKSMKEELEKMYMELIKEKLKT